MLLRDIIFRLFKMVHILLFNLVVVHLLRYLLIISSVSPFSLTLILSPNIRTKWNSSRRILAISAVSLLLSCHTCSLLPKIVLISLEWKFFLLCFHSINISSEESLKCSNFSLKLLICISFHIIFELSLAIWNNLFVPLDSHLMRRLHLG